MSRWVGLVLRLVCEVLLSVSGVSCVSRLPPTGHFGKKTPVEATFRYWCPAPPVFSNRESKSKICIKFCSQHQEQSILPCDAQSYTAVNPT